MWCRGAPVLAPGYRLTICQQVSTECVVVRFKLTGKNVSQSSTCFGAKGQTGHLSANQPRCGDGDTQGRCPLWGALVPGQTPADICSVVWPDAVEGPFAVTGPFAVEGPFAETGLWTGNLTGYIGPIASADIAELSAHLTLPECSQRCTCI